MNKPNDCDQVRDLYFAWTDSNHTNHWLTPGAALRILRRFYEEWPGGMEEFDADLRLKGDGPAFASREQAQALVDKYGSTEMPASQVW